MEKSDTRHTTFKSTQMGVGLRREHGEATELTLKVGRLWRRCY